MTILLTDTFSYVIKIVSVHIYTVHRLLSLHMFHVNYMSRINLHYFRIKSMTFCISYNWINRNIALTVSAIEGAKDKLTYMTLSI